MRAATDLTRLPALLILGLAAAALGSALVSQHVFGLLPCKLCLVQRWPYYVGIPLAAVTALLPPGRRRRLGFGLLALVFLVSAGLGLHHAGVEWGWWPGPTDCGGGMGAASGAVGDFLKELETARVVSCTEAALRVLGLSMAGWNALVSLALAALAARLGAAR
jgi:disulfide bond formation protein DsbB